MTRNVKRRSFAQFCEDWFKTGDGYGLFFFQEAVRQNWQMLNVISAQLQARDCFLLLKICHTGGQQCVYHRRVHTVSCNHNTCSLGGGASHFSLAAQKRGKGQTIPRTIMPALHFGGKNWDVFVKAAVRLFSCFNGCKLDEWSRVTHPHWWEKDSWG